MVHTWREWCTFCEKHMVTEVAADALRGKVMWSASMLGTTNKVFSWSKVSLPTAVHLLLSKGPSCYTPRRTGNRKSKYVCGCIVNANLRVLNLFIKKKIENDLNREDWKIYCALVIGAQKAWKNLKVFQSFLRRQCPPICQKIRSKEDKKPRKKTPKIQCCYSMCLAIQALLYHSEETMHLVKQEGRCRIW